MHERDVGRRAALREFLEHDVRVDVAELRVTKGARERADDAETTR
jgi:hypothetical protein